MAWIGPVIGGALSAFGAISGQNSANQANVGLDKKNRDWQERMANTAVQRRMDDLRSANLNPALTAEGQGATTPSTSAPTVESNMRDASKHIGETANNAIGALQAKANINLTNASAAKAVQEARMAKVAADNNSVYGNRMADMDFRQKQSATESAEIGKEQASFNLDMSNRTAAATEASAYLKNKLDSIASDLSASQLEQFNRTRGALEQEIKQRVRAGQIDLDSLERINSIGGVDAGKLRAVIQGLADILKSYNRKGSR